MSSTSPEIPRKKSVNSSNKIEPIEQKKKILKTSHGSGIKLPTLPVSKGYDPPPVDPNDDTGTLLD